MPRPIAVPGAFLERLEPRTLFAADPISPDHELWLAVPGEAVVDGHLNDLAWDRALPIVRAQPHRDARVSIRLLHSEAGLFIAVEADDAALWADGSGGGSGQRWELEHDDSMTFYFDPDGSREEFFGAGDRAIGINLAPMGAPFAGEGVVRRAKFVRGDGAGGAPDVLIGSAMPSGLAYATVLRGTPNDGSDADEGWTSELFIPWAALGLTAGAGVSFAMNFDIIFDNDGAARSFWDTRGTADRFALPAYIDDHLQGAHSSYADSQAGLRGPVSYADVLLVDPGAAAAPAPIGDVLVARISAQAATLEFTSPGDLATRAWRYEVRVASSPIATESDWRAATPIEQGYIPRGPGLDESLRIVALAPSTLYHVAIRARDAFGNLSPLAGSDAFTTEAAGASPDETVTVSPLGAGLVRERDGSPFIPIGDHLGLSWGYTRGLFPGDVWDARAGIFHNFHDQPSYEGPPAPYFFQLQARGINTMRIFLEFPGLDQVGNPDLPRGSYWLEHPAGTFNPDMRRFLHTLLEHADRYDFHVILSPFDTFLYDDVFSTENPFSTALGGPVADINRFFQSPGVLEMAQRRMDTLIGWVHESPFADRILAWEPLNEWDSWEWTLSPEHQGQREREMAQRAVWVTQLARHIREADPGRLIANSSVARDPRGPAARIAFNSRDFDLQLPHFYTSGSEEPINNPAADRRLLAAAQHAALTSYWIESRIDPRPVLDGEWGLTRAHWPGGVPGYSGAFTRAEDEGLYRAILWTGFALGQAGAGLRIATDELQPWFHSLTPAMRQSQQAMAQFVESGGFDWSRPRARLGVGASDAVAYASGDELQALAYILRDPAFIPTGSSTLEIADVATDRLFDVEYWDPASPGTAAMASHPGVYSEHGMIRLELPDFVGELVVKMRARPDPAAPAVLAAIEHEGVEWVFTTDHVDRLVASVDGGGEIPLARLVGIDRAIRDVEPFITPEGRLNLALLDDRHDVWRLLREADGAWSATNLTRLIDAPGFVRDLAILQPTWGALHIAGLDARGHATNLWWTPAIDRWIHTDLTAQVDGPALGSLTAYSTPWDGLNLAGLDGAGHTLVYWWSPELGAGNWRWQDLTSDFGGPALVGTVAAYATPWGGLNIAGTSPDGRVHVYWWAPELPDEPDRWRITDISTDAGAPALRPGIRGVVSAAGAIDLAASSVDSGFVRLRWTPQSGIWRALLANTLELIPAPAPWSLTPGSLWWLDGSIRRIDASTGWSLAPAA